MAQERAFGAEINRIRGKELNALTTLAYTSAIGFSLIMLSAPIINPILVFLAYIHTSTKDLDAATACKLFRNFKISSSLVTLLYPHFVNVR